MTANFYQVVAPQKEEELGITNSQEKELNVLFYKRQVQASLVRIGTTIFAWIFALTAYIIDVIKEDQFIGITFVALCITLITPCMLLLFKRVSTLLGYHFVLIINSSLLVTGYTLVMYFLGGVEATYLMPLYTLTIVHGGLFETKQYPFILAAICSIAFFLLAMAEATGLLTPPRCIASFSLPKANAILISGVVAVINFATAMLSAVLGDILQKQRIQLKIQNEELLEKNFELEAMQENLRRSHEELERKVIERTREISEINEQLKKEIQERKEAEENYRILFENVRDVVYKIDSDFVLRSITPSVEQSLGYKPEELIGKKITELPILTPEIKEQAMLDIYKVFYGEKIESIYEFVTKDGEKRVGEQKASLLIRDGKVVGLIGVSRDITDRVKAEEEKEKLREQLERARKMEAIGMLAGGVAHDLNNILTAIVGYPDLILLQIPEDSPLRKFITTIKESGMKAAAIVQDLLTLARRSVMNHEVLNLNNIVLQYLKSPELQNLLTHHSAIEIETNLDPELLNIKGSTFHLSKVIMNLVSNAVEAMPKGGKITITSENRYVDIETINYDSIKEGDYVILTVSDTGVGISPEDIQKIFEPFYTKKVMGRSGTGLGMSIVWATVKDHNGYIDVQSEPGKGTTFRIFLPATRETSQSREYAFDINEWKGKGESILVIDDVEGQRIIASNILTQLGYSVVTCGSGEEALDYLKNHSVDLVILDMIMEPGMDGLETYKKILEIHPNQKAIVVSGFAETDRVKETLNLGAGQYVKKPYTIEKLAISVKTEIQK